jgi:anti-sigma factor ChrR (cupin superfamily)
VKLLHGDLATRVVVHPRELCWSPAIDGVSFKRLDCTSAAPRIGTTLIKLEPGARLAEQRHRVSQDLFCLAGSWSDDAGAYGPASFVHHPAGSIVAACSDGGALLLGKTRHGPSCDARIVVETTAGVWQPALLAGLRIMMLHQHGVVRVALLSFPAGARIAEHDHPQGEEFYVLDGGLEDEQGSYGQGTWVRQPRASRHAVHSEDGCTMFSISGHMP